MNKLKKWFSKKFTNKSKKVIIFLILFELADIFLFGATIAWAKKSGFLDILFTNYG